jgi:hypothetical protein
MTKKTALFIGFTWPEPSSTAAGTRMLQLIQFFREKEYRTVFASTATQTALSMDLEAIGVKKVRIKLNDSRFDGFVAGLNPDIVVFDRFLTEEQFGWRVGQFAPQALRMLDTEDLHSLRLTRHELLKKQVPFSIDAWLQNDTTKREIASIYRCDLSLIISDYEMGLLTETLKIDGNLLMHLPFMLDPLNATEVQNWPPFEARKDFICIGNGKHAPNIDAILWLNTEIWPKIRQRLPEAHLDIYGAYLPAHIRQMNNPDEGFNVRGWTENVTEVVGKAKVSLVPLRFGAGIKGKLIDGMQSGTPSVTTSIGAEGMHANHPWNGHIADTAEAFADAAVRLYRNPGEWRSAQQNGVSIVKNLYNKDILGSKLTTTLGKIRNDLQNHRDQNFIGAMLLHHSMASTKYMAKWISAKNKIR